MFYQMRYKLLQFASFSKSWFFLGIKADSVKSASQCSKSFPEMHASGTMQKVAFCTLLRTFWLNSALNECDQKLFDLQDLANFSGLSAYFSSDPTASMQARGDPSTQWSSTKANYWPTPSDLYYQNYASNPPCKFKIPFFLFTSDH